MDGSIVRQDGSSRNHCLAALLLTAEEWPALARNLERSYDGPGGRGRSGAAGLLVLGVFLGSAAWWLTLSTAVGLLRARITPAVLGWVNRVSGLVIAGFGVFALLGLL